MRGQVDALAQFRRRRIAALGAMRSSVARCARASPQSMPSRVRAVEAHVAQASDARRALHGDALACVVHGGDAGRTLPASVEPVTGAVIVVGGGGRLPHGGSARFRRPPVPARARRRPDAAAGLRGKCATAPPLPFSPRRPALSCVFAEAVGFLRLVGTIQPCPGTPPPCRSPGATTRATAATSCARRNASGSSSIAASAASPCLNQRHHARLQAAAGSRASSGRMRRAGPGTAEWQHRRQSPNKRSLSSARGAPACAAWRHCRR